MSDLFDKAAEDAGKNAALDHLKNGRDVHMILPPLGAVIVRPDRKVYQCSDDFQSVSSMPLSSKIIEQYPDLWELVGDDDPFSKNQSLTA
mgnify:CR=1 FL=1